MTVGAILEAGKCRVCGCTDLDPCILPVDEEGHDARCAWMDVERTLCSRPTCVGTVPLEQLVEMFDHSIARLMETEP